MYKIYIFMQCAPKFTYSCSARQTPNECFSWFAPPTALAASPTAQDRLPRRKTSTSLPPPLATPSRQLPIGWFAPPTALAAPPTSYQRMSILRTNSARGNSSPRPPFWRRSGGDSVAHCRVFLQISNYFCQFMHCADISHHYFQSI